ncbi:MAG: HAD family hydrolase [Candidatus Bipolaricaulota bacterium]|nr:HAD family hydrolase [Candidatus Bipolaricaulota bacterium]MCS7273897.1 HAD family hydrolase [Candidatus Bipolaricaulota bacterium]MDW8110817.1 HAD family hydrolase [Candidatus Bipolaricaulota bacterium]MDW8328702.1 HAD family hydrolase [Candidatus Bipolaricaulota bacterium]
MRVKVIFFDMDGTLVWVPGQRQADWFLQILQKLEIFPDPAELERAYRLAERRWQQEVRPKLGFSAHSFVEWNKLILEELKIDGDLYGLAERIQRYWESPADQLFADVPDALEELRRRDIALGIMSHRPLAGIEHSLRRHRIRDYFSWLASPDALESPWGKLDPALWTKLLHLAKANPHQAMHVGDDFETDIRGPRRAGLHAVWIERPELRGRFYPGRLSPSSPQLPSEQASARIANLQELLDLVPT